MKTIPLDRPLQVVNLNGDKVILPVGAWINVSETIELTINRVDYQGRTYYVNADVMDEYARRIQDV